MKKSLFLILAVSLTVLVIGSGVYITYAQTNPLQPPAPTKPLSTTPAFLRDPPTPIPPESLPPDELAIDYYFVNEGEILGLGMQSPRALTAEEKDAVIQIGLNIEPVYVKISQGYNTELGWMAYYKNSGWGGYVNQISKLGKVNPEATYFPAVRIGLGAPQQEAIDVAVDLSKQTAVYAIRRPDKRVNAPSYVQYLTEDQKANLAAIALQTETVQTYIRGAYEVDYQFVAISKSGGAVFSMEYDIVTKGIKAYKFKEIENLSMKIYPAVVFKSDSWMVSTAVDLETGKVMYSFRQPMRQGF